MAVATTRTELSSAGLRAASAGSRDDSAARRMLALALVLDDETRTAEARAAGMDRQTLRDWVHRTNAAGLDGLRNQPNPGAPPRQLDAAQEATLAERPPATLPMDQGPGQNHRRRQARAPNVEFVPVGQYGGKRCPPRGTPSARNPSPAAALRPDTQEPQMPPDQDQDQPKHPNHQGKGWTPADKTQGSRQGPAGADQGDPAGAAAATAGPTSDREATEQAAATIEQETAKHGPAPRKP